MKLNKVLVVYMKSTSEESIGAQNLVKKTLEDNNIEFNTTERLELSADDFINVDLVISVGGDGTFLTTSHFIVDETPMLGVNSHSEEKEGFLCLSDRRTFSEHFKRLLAGDYKLQKRLRLTAVLDGKELMPALNDVFVGHHKPHYTSRYYIELGSKKELHKSSGLIISTPTGSHAWMSSAGGERMDLDSECFQFRARDLYVGRLTKPEITCGILNKNQKVKVTSDREESIVVIDSLSEEHAFEPGSVLEITASDKLLNFICFE